MDETRMNSIASHLGGGSAKSNCIVTRDGKAVAHRNNSENNDPRPGIGYQHKRSWSFVFDTRTWKAMFGSKVARRSFRFPSVIDSDILTYYADSEISGSTPSSVDGLTWKHMAILSAMCVLYMASSTTSSALGILLPDLRTSFVDTTTKELGVMASMVTLGYALVQPFSGLLVLALGPWKAVVLSSLLAMTGNLGFGLSETVESADLFRLWTGLGCGMVYGIVWWFIRSQVPPCNFGMLSGILEASNAIGTVLATLPIYYFEKTIQWQLLFTFILNCVILSASSVAVPLLLPYTTSTEGDTDTRTKPMIELESGTTTEDIENGVSESNRSPPIPLSEVILTFSENSSDSSLSPFSAWDSWKVISWEILTNRNELGAFCVSFLVMGSMDSLGFVWLISMLQGLHGLSLGQAATCLMVSNFSVVPVIFSIGVLSDFVQLRLPFVYIGACLAALHITLLGFTNLNYPGAILVSSLNGISQGFTSTTYAFAAESLSARHTEQAVAWNQLFYMGGVTAMTSILGVVMVQRHDENDDTIIPSHEIRDGCIVVLCSLALVMIPFVVLKETHGRFMLS